MLTDITAAAFPYSLKTQTCKDVWFQLYFRKFAVVLCAAFLKHMQPQFSSPRTSKKCNPLSHLEVISLAGPTFVVCPAKLVMMIVSVVRLS